MPYIYTPAGKAREYKVSRSTTWRHKTGRAKMAYPKGQPNYEAIAITMVRRRFAAFFYAYPEDALQEIRLLVLETQRLNRYAANSSGKGQGCIGIKRFLRMIWRHFNLAAKLYGLRRANGTGAYKFREVSLGNEENFCN